MQCAQAGGVPAATQSVALISDEFARRYLPNEDPIGRRIHIGPAPGFGSGSGSADSSDVMIIGVTGGFKNAGLKLPPQPQILALYAQHPIVNCGFKDMVIRTTSEPHSMEAAIREQLRHMDSDMPFAEVQTIDELVTARTGPEPFERSPFPSLTRIHRLSNYRSPLLISTLVCSKIILDYLPAPHHETDALQFSNVGHRITGNGDHISEFSRLDHANTVLPAQHFCCIDSDGPDHIERRHSGVGQTLPG